MPDQYNIDAGRSEAQKENMRELAAEGKCFMCYENLTEYDNNRVEFETAHWVITPNAYPYEHTSLHMLLIARRHVKSLAALNPNERADLGEAIAEIEKRWKLGSYFAGIRNGDFRYNGGSVEHLHAHVIVGERDPDKFEKVRMKIATLPEK